MSIQPTSDRLNRIAWNDQLRRLDLANQTKMLMPILTALTEVLEKGETKADFMANPEVKAAIDSMPRAARITLTDTMRELYRWENVEQIKTTIQEIQELAEKAKS